jgi:hypothetical protein
LNTWHEFSPSADLSCHQSCCQVASSSQALSGSTEKLLAEKAGLTEFAEALRARLKFFDEYELTASQFAAAAAAPDDADLMPLLHKIDECIAYVAANPQYADAVTYANKFRQLQARAIGLVRGRVQTVLRSASQAVQAAVAEALSGAAAQGTPDAAAAAAAAAIGQGLAAGRSGSGGLGPARSGSMRLAAAGAVLPEGLEVSLLYVRFRAAAEPVLKGEGGYAVYCMMVCWFGFLQGCAVASFVGSVMLLTRAAVFSGWPAVPCGGGVQGSVGIFHVACTLHCQPTCLSFCCNDS